jgi:hypothetical protein
MPDSEQKNRKPKTIIPIPKSDDRSSEDVLRDESTQYGDDAEIRFPRRKRTDARVPIVRDRKEGANQEGGEKPKKKGFFAKLFG